MYFFVAAAKEKRRVYRAFLRCCIRYAAGFRQNVVSKGRWSDIH